MTIIKSIMKNCWDGYESVRIDGRGWVGNGKEIEELLLKLE